MESSKLNFFKLKSNIIDLKVLRKFKTFPYDKNLIVIFRLQAKKRFDLKFDQFTPPCFLSKICQFGRLKKNEADTSFEGLLVRAQGSKSSPVP